jgi:hypothetical protein
MEDEIENYDYSSSSDSDESISLMQEDAEEIKV